MKAAFLDQKTFSDTIDFSDITKHVDLLSTYQLTSPEQVIQRCQGHEIVITNKVELDEAVLTALPELKLICVAATGTNNIDLSAAKRLGITVANAAGYAGVSVAQYIFSQLLHCVQHIEVHNKNTERGLWQASDTFCVFGNPINELAGKTLGIVGYGHIAKKVAKIAEAFDMNILISEHEGAGAIRLGRTNFHDVLRQSDVVSLHCPLTDTTKHLINEETLSLMKSDAILINTARGSIIDSYALKNALLKGAIGYAILDVLDQEPPSPDHPLLSSLLPNLKVTAHIAWASQQAQQRLIRIIGDNIKAFLNDEKKNLVV
jgi:glycerate dehydrogenase